MQVNRGHANPNKPDIQRQISSFPHMWKEESGEMGQSIGVSNGQKNLCNTQ